MLQMYLAVLKAATVAAFVDVSPIARELLLLQHVRLDSHEATFPLCIFPPLVGRFIVYSDIHLEM